MHCDRLVCLCEDILLLITIPGEVKSDGVWQLWIGEVVIPEKGLDMARQ